MLQWTNATISVVLDAISAFGLSVKDDIVNRQTCQVFTTVRDFTPNQ